MSHSHVTLACHEWSVFSVVSMLVYPGSTPIPAQALGHVVASELISLSGKARLADAGRAGVVGITEALDQEIHNL